MSPACDYAADFVVIGGGIVGLATAYALTSRWPARKVLLLEKERRLAAHQSGRNSGVLHSGIYYAPGSHKARTCRAGRAKMIAFCEREDIPIALCGKVIVATSEEERGRLADIYRRGQENGVECALIGLERLRELEPHAAGIAGVEVRDAGVVDYRAVAARLGERLEERGHHVLLGERVLGIDEQPGGVVVRTAGGEYGARYVVACAGLHSDRLARRAGVGTNTRIIPFRGEYHRLRAGAEHLCKALIYPVPDPRYPFLGVHFTRGIDGEVECGPNAVLAFAREGYRRRDVVLEDVFEALTYPGFVRMALSNVGTGLGEMWRSVSRRALARSLARLVPEVTARDLEPGSAGVRAQAMTRDGQLVDDFLFAETARGLHVLNAPSPAATASLAIGEHIAERLSAKLAS